jgi:pimeloyl-ACP methyl ester carboxylesterase
MMAQMLPAPEPQNLLLPNGMSLRLWDYGGDGPPVLTVHGFLDTGRSWRAVAEACGTKARLLCLDWRGHGQSDRVGVGGSYHQFDHLKDLIQVLALLPDLGLAPALLAGHSMGAGIALVAAATQPDLFPKRFLILDNLGGFSMEAKAYWDRIGEFLEATRKEKYPFRSFANRQEGIQKVMANNLHMTEAGAGLWLDGAGKELADGTIELQFDGQLRGPNPFAFPENYWLELCSRVRAKTVIVAPEFGYFGQLPLMQARANVLTNVKVHHLDNLGHHIHVDAPEIVAKHLLTLLTDN